MIPSKQITVMLAEDHAIVRQGLCALLKADGCFLVVGEARTGREAVEMAKALRPDVILMDIAMPVLNGLEATRQILTASPAARIIVLSAHSDDEYLERMNAAGVVVSSKNRLPLRFWPRRSAKSPRAKPSSVRPSPGG